MKSTIDQAIVQLLAGGMVVVCDDEDRENEGDLVALADRISAEVLIFMTLHGRGLICAPISKEIAERLQLDLMVRNTSDPHETAFTVSVDHKSATTGISAAERANTLLQLTVPNTTPEQFQRPGHIFPLIAKDGGVFTRMGHTEATVDLAKLCGAREVGVICEIMNEDGSMSRYPELLDFAKQYDLPLITIEDLKEYRIRTENLIQAEAATMLPTEYGTFHITVFKTKLDDEEHVAIVKGNVSVPEAVYTRVHSECLTGDVFHSKRCDCGQQLEDALRTLREREAGVLLYLRQEGRGIGLFEKIKAYQLQSDGLDTVEANEALGFKDDEREFTVAAVMLGHLGVSKVSLATNNPEKVNGLQKSGIIVEEIIPFAPTVYEENERYMNAKKEKLGHLI
ncbi:LOW QUALITY PROTEIN: 3,4-dihydroxy-2-butanone 4-phosphate synthase [Geomicrobium sp. JCM 19037]|nr:LOW QUALITY PROTEIN: 3,4-dihydroxy-2-butanone 4-phosphate synthase [Geomicrobium sp. JCM 19037]